MAFLVIATDVFLVTATNEFLVDTGGTIIGVPNGEQIYVSGNGDFLVTAIVDEGATEISGIAVATVPVTGVRLGAVNVTKALAGTSVIWEV